MRSITEDYGKLDTLECDVTQVSVSRVEDTVGSFFMASEKQPFRKSMSLDRQKQGPGFIHEIRAVLLRTFYVVSVTVVVPNIRIYGMLFRNVEGVSPIPIVQGAEATEDLVYCQPEYDTGTFTAGGVFVQDRVNSEFTELPKPMIMHKPYSLGVSAILTTKEALSSQYTVLAECVIYYTKKKVSGNVIEQLRARYS